jgi:hypothetical protein
VAGGVLGSEHLLVDFEPAAGKVRKQIEHGANAFLRRVARHQRGYGDGAGIDHRVERPLGHFVERSN